jgi:ABC-type phosphate transport system substrate-binding protein
LFFLLFASNLHAVEIVVIVNEAGPLVNLSAPNIRDIYLGEKSFEGGIKIAAINYSEGPVKNVFFTEVLKMTSKEYRLYWTKKLFQAGGTAPMVINNPKNILDTVRKTKGAIGYVAKEDLKDIKGIKIIEEIGQ